MRKTASFPNKFHISPQKMQFITEAVEDERLVVKTRQFGQQVTSANEQQQLPPSVILRE